jgi:hypothetical protein
MNEKKEKGKEKEKKEKENGGGWRGRSCCILLHSVEEERLRRKGGTSDLTCALCGLSRRF